MDNQFKNRRDERYRHEPPLVSIICFCRNAKDTIRNCINSILAQDYPNIEIVVQDGASTDGTLEILASYGDSIKLVSEPDDGSGDAMFKCLGRVRGEIIGSCLADEQMLPQTVSWGAHQLLHKYPDAGAVYGDHYNIDIEGKITGVVRHRAWDFSKVLCSEYTPPFCASFFRRSSFEAIGLKTYTNCGEFDLWIRLGAEFPIVYAPGLIAKYGIHEDALSFQVDLIEKQANGKFKVLEKFFNRSGLSEEIKALRVEALAAVHTWLVDAYCNLGAWHNNVQAWEKARYYFCKASGTAAQNTEFLRREGMRLLTHALELIRDGQKSDARPFVELVLKTPQMFEDSDLSTVRRIYRRFYDATSDLDQLIPPEIKNDVFYEDIKRLAAHEGIEHILEIGSSAGQGSTSAFASGIRNGGCCTKLYCMEISRVRFDQLKKRYQHEKHVHCYRASSVPLDAYPTEADVSKFYNSTATALNQYPLEQVLGWLRQDKDYLQKSEVCDHGIEKIKDEHGIRNFDLVLIDGSEFTGQAEMEHIYGAKIIMLDDINGYKNHRNYQRLKNDPAYKLTKENWELRNGYAIFHRTCTTELPVHFFTIVLNGEPYIRYHIDQFKKLELPWHWHIIEGVADLKHDTAWGAVNGGRIPSKYHENGLSVDGTAAYLDQLAEEFPNHITLYRRENGTFWDGKLDMVNAPLKNLPADCLLWQLDADELWRDNQIKTAHRLFQEQPDRTAAFFHCHFFVGPHLLTTTYDTYSHNSTFEWIRLWRYRKGMRWKSHEPPCLMVEKNEKWEPVADIAPFTLRETEAAGLVFTHYAYGLIPQVAFKEDYYGYDGAVKQWQLLQQVEKLPVRLAEYFRWVKDGTLVDRVENRIIGKSVPPVVFEDFMPQTVASELPKRPHVVIDGVIFQLQAKSAQGIFRVWTNLIPRLIRHMPHADFTLLQREGAELTFGDMAVRPIPGLRLGGADMLDSDDEMLRIVCSDLKADIFISSYYTRAPGVQNILMVHDLIPELMEYDLSQPEWLAKQRVIETADGFISVSGSTQNDLANWYPQVANRPMHIAHNGLDGNFKPPQENDILNLRRKLGIDKPYVLLVGNRGGYKKGIQFLEAVAKLPADEKPSVLCVGGEAYKSTVEEKIQKSLDVRYVGRLSDAQLAAAYGGAVALCVPSIYEGFGLPVIEAMACGCPVLAYPSAGVSEVGGNAICYADLSSADEIRKALNLVRNEDLRSSLRKKGFIRARRFDWEETTKSIAAFISGCVDKKSIILTAVVSTYNAVEFIHGCLEDLTCQSLAGALEIIVVDSASEQGEAAVIRRFQNQFPHIKYIRTKRRENVYQAWNRGIKFALGQYVTNANTDDRHRQDAFERMVEVLEADESVALVYADVLVSQEANETFRNCTPKGMMHWHDWDRRTLLEKGCFIGPQPVWRKKVHAEYGYFNERYTVSSDYDFWLRISQTNDFYHIAKPLGLYMDRPDSIEHRNVQRKLSEDNEIIKKYQTAAAQGRIIHRLPKEEGSASNNDAAKARKVCEPSPATQNRRQAGAEEITQGGEIMNSPETILNAIDCLTDSGHCEAAAWAMDKMQSDFPDTPEIFDRMAVKAYEQGDMGQAHAYFEKAAALAPRQVAIQKNLGDFYYVVQKEAEKALGQYAKVLEIEPNHVETLMLAGHVSISLHRYPEAQAYYQKAKSLDPTNATACEFLEKMGRSALEPATEKMSVDDLYTDALDHAQKENRSEAMARLEQVLEQDHDHGPAHNDLGVLHYESGNMEMARQHYEKAVESMPENETFQKNLADFYWVELGDPIKAMEQHLRVLKLAPHDTDTLLSCGQICMSIQKSEDARDFFETALTVEPWNQDAQKLMRQLEEASGEDGSPCPADDLYGQAQELASTGDLAGAIRQIKLLLTQSPGLAKAHNDLGVLYYETGDMDLAEASYQQAVQLDPKGRNYRKNLADFYLFERGRAQDAMQLYLQILEADPEDVEALNANGVVCVALGQMDDARHFYHRVLEIEPWNEFAQKALGEMSESPLQSTGETLNNAVAG